MRIPPLREALTQKGLVKSLAPALGSKLLSVVAVGLRNTAKFTSSLRGAVLPNTSFNRTRYGKRRKPGLRHLVHHLSPGFRRLPPRAG
jgi:hypothetical protein